MNENLDAALVADFPKLYAQRHGDMRETALCWGFECGDGWEPLIRELSAQLEFLLVNTPVTCEAVQVKEKFGTLRFYTSGIGGGGKWGDIVFALIDAAEARSAWTCEHCGQQGKLRDDGWMRTLCDDCEAERLRKLSDSASLRKQNDSEGQT